MGQKINKKSEVLVEGKVSGSVALPGGANAAAAVPLAGGAVRRSLHYRDPARERLGLFLSLRFFEGLELSLAKLTKTITTIAAKQEVEVG